MQRLTGCIALVAGRAARPLSGIAAAAFALLATGPAEPLKVTPAQAAPQAWPLSVIASYQVTFNGFEIGQFDFKSTVTQQAYSLSGNAELSALLGVFKWKGLTHSTGSVATADPKPKGYNFFYKSSSKTGSVKLDFDGAGVSKTVLLPPSYPSAKTVPLKPEHMTAVLDPLTAIMAMTKSDEAKPCTKSVSIFDGKQRFDLALTWRRQEFINEQKPSGQPGVLFVCGVTYKPIAGHKLNDETKALTENDGIEIGFRPVPSAGLLVPHRITIPTYYGMATLTARKVSITTSDRDEIALIN